MDTQHLLFSGLGLLCFLRDIAQVTKGPTNTWHIRTLQLPTHIWRQVWESFKSPPIVTSWISSAFFACCHWLSSSLCLMTSWPLQPLVGFLFNIGEYLSVSEVLNEVRSITLIKIIYNLYSFYRMILGKSLFTIYLDIDDVIRKQRVSRWRHNLIRHHVPLHLRRPHRYLDFFAWFRASWCDEDQATQHTEWPQVARLAMRPEREEKPDKLPHLPLSLLHSLSNSAKTTAIS